jgi:hypothetical protein
MSEDFRGEVEFGCKRKVQAGLIDAQRAQVHEGNLPKPERLEICWVSGRVPSTQPTKTFKCDRTDKFPYVFPSLKDYINEIQFMLVREVPQ